MSSTGVLCGEKGGYSLGRVCSQVEIEQTVVINMVVALAHKHLVITLGRFTDNQPAVDATGIDDVRVGVGIVGRGHPDPEAVVALESFVERAGREADRIHISQVFATRLHLGMYLQTDPSVIYGLGERYDGNLRRKHLREDTPYNTYVHKGLPPTPIALPGINSIAAAMNPGNGVYLYFVAQGDGGSQFSVSLEDHLAAVRKYQLR